MISCNFSGSFPEKLRVALFEERARHVGLAIPRFHSCKGAPGSGWTVTVSEETHNRFCGKPAKPLTLRHFMTLRVSCRNPARATYEPRFSDSVVWIRGIGSVSA